MPRALDVVALPSGVVATVQRATGPVLDDGASAPLAALPLAASRRAPNAPVEHFDVGIVGGGPGGGAAALFAARAGARTVLWEGRADGGAPHDWGNRWRMVMLSRNALRGLDVDDVWNDVVRGPNELSHLPVVRIGELERSLHAHSASEGAEWRFASPLSSARAAPQGGMDIETPDGVVHVGALLDFSGGRSGIADAHGIGLQAPLPGVRYGFLGHYGPQDPERTGLKWGTSVLDLPDSVDDRMSASVLNHPRHGAHVDIAGLTPERIAAHPDARRLHETLAHAVGVEGVLAAEPYVLPMIQQRAAAARAGDLFVGGDAAGRIGPHRFPGVLGATRDAKELGEAAAVRGEGRERALATAAWRVETRVNRDLFQGLQALATYDDVSIHDLAEIAQSGRLGERAGSIVDQGDDARRAAAALAMQLPD